MTEQAQQGDTADMAGQDPATDNPTGQAPAGDSDVGQEPSVDDRQAELARYQAEIKKLRDENAKHRLKAKEEAERAKAEEARKLEEAKKRGELEPVIEGLQKQLAELAPFADLGKHYAEQETARIDKAREEMPEHWREALDAIPDLKGKSKLVSAYEKERAALAAAPASQPKSPARPAPSGAAPGSPPAPFNPETATREQWNQLRDTNPDEYARLTGGGRAPVGTEPLWRKYMPRMPGK